MRRGRARRDAQKAVRRMTIVVGVEEAKKKKFEERAKQGLR
jgi:hypothetical protein